MCVIQLLDISDNDDTDEKLTPLMKKFDTMKFTREGQSSYAIANCEGAQPPNIADEALQWQPVPGEGSSAYVFSAFIDRRWNPAIVLIIGLATEYTTSQDGIRQRYCRLWFRGETKSHFMAAAFQYVPETHRRK